MHKITQQKMKSILYVAFGFIIAACGNNAHDELAHNHTEHGVSHEGHEHESENHNHEVERHDHKAIEHEHESVMEVILNHKQAERFGVKTQKVVAGTFHDVIKVTGQIVDAPDAAGVVVAPTSGVVNLSSKTIVGTQIGRSAHIATIKASVVTGGDPNAAARAAVSAAKREIDRLKPLHERGIVSTADYNRALAELDAANALYSPNASSGAAIAPIAGTITQIFVAQGQYVEVGTPIATISSSSKLNLRADLPQKYYARASEISGVKIKTPYSDEIVNLNDLGAKRSNTSQLVSSTPGYIPIYFTLTNNGTLVPGTFVEVYLLGQERQNVIQVPLKALSEQQGNYFVYVKLDADCYAKTPVQLGDRDGEFIEIVSGLHNGDDVVVEGTTTVRLAESSNVVPEGHSHNH